MRAPDVMGVVLAGGEGRRLDPASAAAQILERFDAEAPAR